MHAKGESCWTPYCADSEELHDDSFDLNKSYPCARRPSPKKAMALQRWHLRESISGDSMNSYSCSSVAAQNIRLYNFILSKTPPGSLLDCCRLSSSFLGQLATGDLSQSGAPAIQNPNKAVVTVDAKTMEILVANEQACKLFGYNSNDLVGLKLSDLLKKTNQIMEEALGEEHMEEDGTMVVVSGKVVEAVKKSGAEVPISIWARGLTSEGHRCLVAMEHVERIAACVTFMHDGRILSCDHTFARLHGYQGADEVTGLSVRELIPSLCLPPHRRTLPKTLRIQRVTGKGKDGATFPLCIKLKAAVDCGKSWLRDQSCGDMPESVEAAPVSPGVHEPAGPSRPGSHKGSSPGAQCLEGSCHLSPGAGLMFSGTVWVFAALSGLLTLHPDGSIHSIGDSFAAVHFGYRKSELQGKSVTFLMPGFYECLCAAEETSNPPLQPIEGGSRVHTPAHGRLLFHAGRSHSSRSNAGSPQDPCRCSDSTNPPAGSMSSQSGPPLSPEGKRRGERGEDPSTLLAGDMAMVQQEAQRQPAGKAQIFTGTSDRLENQGSTPSTLSSPVVTSTPFDGQDGTTELMEQAALVSPGGSGFVDADTTSALLLTLDLPVPCPSPACSGHELLPDPRTSPVLLDPATLRPARLSAFPVLEEQALPKPSGADDGQRPCSELTDLQDSSFEVISVGSRSSSGFCEKWAGGLGRTARRTLIRPAPRSHPQTPPATSWTWTPTVTRSPEPCGTWT
ncbi:hypothetical protein AAFF_G00117900 [Aldrovandia affinis]|uniref:PAS domain-containing protein n=1 Tax=Aldrovandia affinis TaxID=143900 RepID=A0AAD7RSX1_9TELE|nr:hypothetical protein AAFF_G00117900 [Aldrovandia affinis]